MTTVHSESADGFVLALSRQFAVYRMFLQLVEGPITAWYWSIVYGRGVWNCYHIVADLQTLKHCASLSARSIQKAWGLGPVFIKIPLMLFPQREFVCLLFTVYLKISNWYPTRADHSPNLYLRRTNPSTTKANSIISVGRYKLSDFCMDLEIWNIHSFYQNVKVITVLKIWFSC